MSAIPARADTRGARAPHVLAAEHLVSLQRENGCWEGEMVWCTMILSQHIIVRSIVGHPPDQASRDQMIRHYETQRTVDGAFGLHPESCGYVFTTALAYVALRLLGVAPDDPLVERARRWLHAQKGGVLAIPTWGKFWLAMIDLYGYEGVNPCPPEIFLAPGWLPFHPNRFYCHTRYIYLGIAYLYGRRFRAHLGPLRDDLRRELYPGRDYERIDFAAHRHDIAESDLHVRPSLGLRLAYDALSSYEKVHVRHLRELALGHCFERILYEQRVSRYQGLSPVNGLLNCLAIYAKSPHHPDLLPSLRGMESWRWEDALEGVRYVGARSNAWDTAFSMQALMASREIIERARPALLAGYGFLRDTQLLSELPHHVEEHRDSIIGGWCFSDGQHRWPVSDCTAEALCAILAAHEALQGTIPAAERIPDERLTLAARFILSRQNADGGFGTYERRRGAKMLEAINPSEMYGNCMTERSYIECTASSLSALCHFRRAHPERLRPRIDDAIRRATAFLRGCQRPDGSYLGFWGINFTYAIFHVAKALRAAGAPASDPTLARAARWLVSKQRPDGGWGEHYRSCLEDRYVEHAQSQVVMTSWALLALLEVDPRSPSVERGVRWLRQKQREDGSFPQQAVNGVFFGTAGLDYRLYKSYFPAWALARYEALSLEPGGPQMPLME